MGRLGNAVTAATKVRSESTRDKAFSEAVNGDAQRALALAVIYLADTLRR